MPELDPHERLPEFLTRCFARKPLPILQLAHQASDGMASVLDTIDLELEAKEPSGEDAQHKSTPDELADRFISDTQGHCDSTGRIQRYQLLACDHKGAVISRTSWRMAPNAMSSGLGDHDTEPATMSGALAQAMRHVEAVMRITLETQAVSVGNMCKRLEVQGKQIEAFQEQQLEQFRLMQELLDKRQERQLEVDMHRFDQERAERGMMLLEKGVLPMVAAHLSGAKDTLGFVHSLSTEQLEKIYSALNAEQIAWLNSQIQKGIAAEEGLKVLSTQGIGQPKASKPGNGS